MVRDGQVVGTALTLDVSTGGEQGLLGLDFSADGSKMYVDYTDPAGDTRVDEYQMSGGVANVATRRELLFVDQPFANHNGGQVTRGPDGKLYVAFGDGGSGGDPLDNGQDLTTLLGKIVRIDPTPAGGSPYTVPDDNPFVGQAGVDEAIWMYGLRNPWRFSFDRAAGDVWIGDVGQNAYEEVDFVVSAQRNAGVNWGWSLREGRHQFKGPKPPGARDPIVELPHADGDCAVTGGYVYRGASIANLGGAYVYADFCVGALRAEVQQGGRIVQSRYLGPQVSQVTTFGQGRLGELYVASRTGTLYKLVPR
jgi:glucose/arabinose dehydrogenase